MHVHATLDRLPEVPRTLGTSYFVLRTSTVLRVSRPDVATVLRTLFGTIYRLSSGLLVSNTLLLSSRILSSPAKILTGAIGFFLNFRSSEKVRLAEQGLGPLPYRAFSKPSQPISPDGKSQSARRTRSILGYPGTCSTASLGLGTPAASRGLPPSCFELSIQAGGDPFELPSPSFAQSFFSLLDGHSR